MKYHIFRSFALVLLVLTSCSTGDVLQQILENKVEAPVFLGCRPVSPTEIAFHFSESVRLVSLNFDTALDIESVEEGEEVRVFFKEALEEGQKVTADILVEDSATNTLNVIVPFRTRNDRMPAMVFNEIRTEYSRPRAEFVEFFVLESGNLGAMRLFIAGFSISNPVYEFSPIEVKAGEYITLHLRTIEDGTADETGTNLALSGGTGSNDEARDLWVPGTTKLVRRTDALWLLDQDDRILDAVLLSENPGTSWANQSLAAAAELFGREKAWLPPGEVAAGWIPGPSDAVITAGTTATRTINRDESRPPSPRAENWYVTATSGNSPGRSNDPRRLN